MEHVDIIKTADVCVYYDGGCPLCRAEIKTYKNALGGDSLRWIDANSCGLSDLGPDLDPSTAMAKMHVRRSDGTLVQGAAAFAEIWNKLPRWRWLYTISKIPGLLTVMDLVYSLFLLVRPIWRPAAGTLVGFPRNLLRELRTDHAGETGAVMIYKGILAVQKNVDLRAFAQNHLQTEMLHLSLLEQIVPNKWRSWLLPLWRFSGWLTGAIPGLFGPRAVYATIQAVETYVDTHYASQILMIDKILSQNLYVDTDARLALDIKSNLHKLRSLLVDCQADEVGHRDDARAHWNEKPSYILRFWIWTVSQGSKTAVSICRYI